MRPTMGKDTEKDANEYNELEDLPDNASEGEIDEDDDDETDGDETDEDDRQSSSEASEAPLKFNTNKREVVPKFFDFTPSIAQQVSLELGIHPAYAKDLVDLFFDVCRALLCANYSIYFKEIGVFYFGKPKIVWFRNVLTGQYYHTRPKVKLFVKFSEWFDRRRQKKRKRDIASGHIVRDTSRFLESLRIANERRAELRARFLKETADPKSKDAIGS